MISFWGICSINNDQASIRYEVPSNATIHRNVQKLKVDEADSAIIFAMLCREEWANTPVLYSLGVPSK